MSEPLIGTLKELAVEYSKKQPKQVENITEKTPILDHIKFEPASHAMWNIAEEVTDVSGGGFVELDAELEEVSVASKLRKVDLSIMGGKMYCGEDKARMFGGKEKYFAKKQPVVLKNLGMKAETSIIYDNLRRFALDCGNKINATATGNANYSLLAVRWERGETCGLYSPEGFEQGALINTLPINGGSLYEKDGKLIYGVRYKGYFGIQLLNTKTVGGIFNITADKLPTEMQVDDLLDMVRADANTFLYGHPKMASFLSEIGKGQRYQMDSKDTNVKRRITHWDDVPIVTSRQFLDAAEAVVSFA